MCGVSGVAGWVSTVEKDVVTDLLTLNIVRGADSTGIGVVTRNDRDWGTVVKTLGTPFGDGGDWPGLFNLKTFDKAMKLTGVKAIIGHNRAATRGDITPRNAHPFKFHEGIIGAHNGTLNFSVQNRLPGGKECETDSEAVFKAFALQGVEKTLAELEGAWALVWYDHRDNTINFLRNKERPLHYIFSEDKQTLIWSSDYSPLMYAVHRQKVKIGSNKPMLLSENTWLSWKLPDVNKQFAEPIRRKLTGKESKVTIYNGHNWHGPGYDYADDGYAYFGKHYDNGAYSYQAASCSINKNEANDASLHSSEDVQVSPSEPVEDSPFKDDTDIALTELEKLSKEADSIAQKAINKRNENKGHPLVETEWCPTTRRYVPKGEAKIPVHNRQPELFPGSNQPPSVTNNVIPMTNAAKKHFDATYKKFQDQYKVLPKDWILKFADSHNRVYWNPSNETWKWFRCSPVQNANWTLTEVDTPPSILPFRFYDPDKGGHHAFKYERVRRQGSKVRDRVISFRGYKGSLLVQKSFEALMQHGCTNCQRVPRWGNIVTFFDNKNFLCEHCEIMPSIVKTCYAIKQS